MCSRNLAQVVLALLLLSCSVPTPTVKCAECLSRPCQPGSCCSQYCYCGMTSDYCSEDQNCQAGCWPKPVAPSRRVRGTYFAGYSGINPKKINSTLFTHVFYAFAKIDTKTFQLTQADPASEAGPSGRWSTFVASLKRGNPKSKTILLVGGGDASAARAFADVARDGARRRAFAWSAVKVLRQYGFDGVDMDWEFPANSTEKSNHAELLTSLRAAFDAESRRSRRPRLLLTSAVSAYRSTVERSYDIVRMNSVLDLVLVMCYDFHGAWERKTGMHTALWDEGNPDLSCIGGMNAWTQGGLSPSKILMGLASYGKSWTLANEKLHGIGARASGPGTAGKFTQTPGVLSFPEIEDMVKSGGVKVYNVRSRSRYAYRREQFLLMMS